jgi:predicted heme/steroid binding protein
MALLGLCVLMLAIRAAAERTFTRSELAKYKGEHGGPIYLAVRGHVFDVSAGRKHYGPGGGYSGFAGRDASRAFADLCFTDDCLKRAHILDDSMTQEQKDSVQHWFDFYQNELAADGSKKYPHVGRVVDDSEL